MLPTVLAEAHHNASLKTGESEFRLSKAEEKIVCDYLRIFHDGDSVPESCEFLFADFLQKVQSLRDTGEAKISSGSHTIAFVVVTDVLTISITDDFNTHEMQEVTLMSLLVAFGL